MSQGSGISYTGGLGLGRGYWSGSTLFKNLWVHSRIESTNSVKISSVISKYAAFKKKTRIFQSIPYPKICETALKNIVNKVLIENHFNIALKILVNLIINLCLNNVFNHNTVDINSNNLKHEAARVL